MNPGGPIRCYVFLYHDLQASKLGTILQLVVASVGAYVRSSLIYIWHMTTITFLPLLAVLTGTKYGNRWTFSLTESRSDCSKMFVFGIKSRSNICVHIRVCIIIYHYILLCVIICSKLDVNIAYCLVMTLLLTKYLASAEVLVYTADCVVKHLLACSYASVSFPASFTIFGRHKVMRIQH